MRFGGFDSKTPHLATTRDLTQAQTHFAFGENWRDYLEHIDDEAVRQAEVGMLKLIPPDRLAGARLIDIGCGSGLHALAAIRLGASKVVAIDIDRNSVAATTELLGRYAPSASVTVEERSIFDTRGQFDIVYSWGVLHHTGDMWRAIKAAAALVTPGGLFAIALYQKTPSCGAWAKIKRFYTAAGSPARLVVRSLYTAAYLARLAASGKSPFRYVREYKNSRGMNFFTDVHDWLGGYPYESATPNEILAFVGKLGFHVVFDGRLPPGKGVFGTGCAEFTFVRM